jgi:hypothetical protein
MRTKWPLGSFLIARTAQHLEFLRRASLDQTVTDYRMVREKWEKGLRTR